MKVLVLAPQPFFQLRGTPIATLQLLETLAKTGHEVDVLTFHEGEDVEIPNCRLHRIPSIPFVKGVPPGFSVKKLICDVFLLLKTIQFCRRETWDAIHAVEESVFIAWMMNKWFGIPYVYDMDSSLPEQLVESKPYLRPLLGCGRRLESIAIGGSHGVITVCKSLEDIARQRATDVTVVRVEDVSLIADDDPFDGNVLTDLDGPIVMYVGNLQRYQGIELLLQSFATLRSVHPDARLVVFGGASKDIARYRRRASRLGIQRRTHFLGVCDRSMLMSYLKRADVLVSPRLGGRNTPMKIYSYLDSGTPTVATRLATHTQVLNDNVAVLVKPEAKALAEGIASLLEEPALARALGARAQRYVREHFRADAAAETIATFYAKLESRITTAPSQKEAMLA